MVVVVVTYRLRPPQRIIMSFGTCSSIYAHPTQGLEACVCKDEDAAVVRFEIVDLLAEEEAPEIFADEFYCIQGGLRAGFARGEATLC